MTCKHDDSFIGHLHKKHYFHIYHLSELDVQQSGAMKGLALSVELLPPVSYGLGRFSGQASRF
jgi:hypothetical protein